MHVHVHGHVHRHIHGHRGTLSVMHRPGRWTKTLAVILIVMARRRCAAIVTCRRATRVHHRVLQRQQHIRHALTVDITGPWYALTPGTTPTAEKNTIF